MDLDQLLQTEKHRLSGGSMYDLLRRDPRVNFEMIVWGNATASFAVNRVYPAVLHQTWDNNVGIGGRIK